jgi:hypothetical protein
MVVASSIILEVRARVHGSPDYATRQAGNPGRSNLDTMEDSVDLKLCFGLLLSHDMCSLRQLKSA